MIRSLIVILGLPLSAAAQVMISGNEAKLDLHTGVTRVVPNPGPDSISILDFSEFPPAVQHLENISNSVIGPPSNIAITPDESLALIASSLMIDPDDPAKWKPDNLIHILDLKADPPKVVGEVRVDQQPSGISITRDGKQALVANRASGTVTLLTIDGQKVTVADTVKVCAPEDEVSDVAISPDGRLVLASVCQGGYLAVLELVKGKLTLRERKVSTYGKPYRCVITSDGELAVTAGSGQGMPDADALTVVDLQQEPLRAVDYITIPSGPESLDVSPDGKYVAAVLMNGSNTAAESPLHTDHGLLVLLQRKGDTYELAQELKTARIPEGVAFTPDGKRLVVQGHPDQQLWLYALERGKLKDTGERISVPGFPSSLRIADLP